MKRLRIAEGGPTSPVAWEPHDKTRTFPQLNGVEVHVLDGFRNGLVVVYALEQSLTVRQCRLDEPPGSP